MAAFLLFTLLLLILYMYYNPLKEGFQAATESSLLPIKPAQPVGVKVEQPWGYSNVNAPVNATPPKIVPPPVRNAGEQPSASDLPGLVPGAPYLQIARTDPRPFEDPTLLKTTRQRIAEIQERLKGFLAFKAQLISDRSDPQIQMPLSTARADFERLKSSLNVLSRNPSIQPTQTEQQMDEIDDNLAYLEHEVEKIQMLSPGEEMPAPLKSSVFEGFQDTTPTQQFGDQPEAQPEPVSNYSMASTVANTGITDIENTAAEQAKRNSERATLDDLKDFIGRVTKEQLRLSRSGTTDPIISARLAGLNRIKNDVQDIVNRVSNKQMREDEIPIKKSEIRDALREIKEGKTPGIISTSAANNLPSQASMTALSPLMPGIPTIPNKALEKLTKQTQVSIGFNYADSLYNFLKLLGLPGMDSEEEAKSSLVPPLPDPATNLPKSTPLYETKTRHMLDGSTVATYTGFTEDECKKACDDDDNCDGFNYRWGNVLNPECIIRNGTTQFTADLYTDASKKIKEQSSSAVETQGFMNMSSSPAIFSPNIPKMNDADSKAPFPMRTTDWVYNGGEAVVLGQVGHFDWKTRSKEIEGQIRKRNMNPRDFGALVEGSQVASDFSWKGYTKMICNRLGTSYDTGLAVACGCPPDDWPGWQIPSRS